MNITIIKGVLKDRLVIGFWIGEHMQSIVVSYTELKELLPEEDIKKIIETPFGIWKAWCTLKLRPGE